MCMSLCEGGERVGQIIRCQLKENVIYSVHLKKIAKGNFHFLPKRLASPAYRLVSICLLMQLLSQPLHFIKDSGGRCVF